MQARPGHGRDAGRATRSQRGQPAHAWTGSPRPRTAYGARSRAARRRRARRSARSAAARRGPARALRRASQGARPRRGCRPCRSRSSRPSPTRRPRARSWLHEIKFDGYRMLARHRRTARSRSSAATARIGRRFSAIAAALAALPAQNAVLDGEVVRLQPSGISSLLGAEGRSLGKAYRRSGLLRLRPAPSRRQDPDRRAACCAQGSARGAARRRRRTGRCVSASTSSAKAAQFFAKACRRSSKASSRSAPTRPIAPAAAATGARSKCVDARGVRHARLDRSGRQARAGSARCCSAITTGEASCIYAGAVGTGFDRTTLAALAPELDRRRATRPPRRRRRQRRRAARIGCGRRWSPRSQYSEWTADGRLRHPSFLGLREDKEAREVVLDRTAAPAEAGACSPVRRAARRSAADGGCRRAPDPSRQAALSRRSGITKRDLAQYYVAVADAMLPHVRGRPLTWCAVPKARARNASIRSIRATARPRRSAASRSPRRRAPRPISSPTMSRAWCRWCRWACSRSMSGARRGARSRKPDRIIFDLDPDGGSPGSAWSRARWRCATCWPRWACAASPRRPAARACTSCCRCCRNLAGRRSSRSRAAIADELVRRHPERLYRRAAQEGAARQDFRRLSAQPARRHGDRAVLGARQSGRTGGGAAEPGRRSRAERAPTGSPSRPCPSAWHANVAIRGPSSTR